MKDVIILVVSQVTYIGSSLAEAPATIVLSGIATDASDVRTEIVNKAGSR